MSDRKIYGRRDRLQLTISQPMRFALAVLSEQRNSNPSAQATQLLRQALDRTIQTAEVQHRLAQHRAHRTAREWREDATPDWIIETAFAEEQAALRTTTTTTPARD